MALDPSRVQSIFGAVIESNSAEDREAILDRECLDDQELRSRVEALLRAHDLPNSLLDQPSVEQAGQGIEPGVRHQESVSIPRIGPIIPGYEILEELGRGGMGVVYKARQVVLDRPCALKMILGGPNGGRGAAGRFLAEARIIAQLQHPQIVQIHHIGEAEGLPFLELEYVDGGSLDKVLGGIPWEARRAASLIELLADAIAETHRRGIVHRDLKPGNILLTADGTPKITDFGLAKLLGTQSGLSAPELIVGSPSYMAPEQARGPNKQLGPTADVYALGAILYELLTGRPPFRGATILETLDQLLTVDPVPPARLVPGLPLDVVSIVMKCLQKEPGKRYPSADALADDLGRFLAGKATVARPVPAWERASRWCRRHPAPAALTATVVMVTVLGLAGILWQWGEAVKARDLASKRAIAESNARRQTETALIDMYSTNGIAAGDQGEPARAMLWFANAARRDQAESGRRRANEVRARTWGRRAFNPLHALVVNGIWSEKLEVHPSGRFLIATEIDEGQVRRSRKTLWDLELESSIRLPGDVMLAPAAAWNPSGDALAVGLEGGDVVVARFPGGDRPTRIPFPSAVRKLVYSLDGRYLAIAGGNSARVWDVGASRFASPDLIHPQIVTSLAIDPKGRFLATGCMDQRARVFDLSSPDIATAIWPSVPHTQSAYGPGLARIFDDPPLFIDDGRQLLTLGDRTALSWRDMESGEETRTLKLSELDNGIVATRPSPDGKHLALFGFQSPDVRLLDVATGEVVGPILRHKNTVLSLAFSPDSRMLATGSGDNMARVWSVPEGELLAGPLDLHRAVRAVAFDSHGRTLVTQDMNLVRLWSLPDDGVPVTRIPWDGQQSFAVSSADGKLAFPTGMSFAVPGRPRFIVARQIASGQPEGPAIAPGGPIVDAALSPDGQSIATLTGFDEPSNTVQEVALWDRASGRLVWRARLPTPPRSLAFRPDGGRLAVLCEGGEVPIFEALDGREILRCQADRARPPADFINNGKVGYSPDGRSLVSWGGAKQVRVWDAGTGGLRYPPLMHRDKCHDVQFSPDGRSFVLASCDGSVRVRDFATGTIIADLPTHPDYVFSARFSPDGRMLVTARRDRAVRVWDWAAGRLVCPQFDHGDEAFFARFTPDGRWVASVSGDGMVRIWDWWNGKPVTPPILAGHQAMSLTLTPDGKHAIVGGTMNSGAVLDLSVLDPIEVDSDILYRRAELAAGQWLHERGGAVNLSADEWLDRWRAFRRRTQGGLGVDIRTGTARP